MKIEFDPEKREKTLLHRGVDMAHAAEVLVGRTFTTKDERFDYGEDRFITFGLLNGRMMFVAWTLRDEVYRIISMRKANDREQKEFGPRLD